MAPVIRGNSLYTIVDGPSWTQAEANSVKLGGHLVTVNDSKENTWILQNILGSYPTVGDAYWIGLTDAAVENQFKWINDEQPSYFNWYPGEPSNDSGNADFGQIWNYLNRPGQTAGTWNDAPLDNNWTSQGIAEIPFIRRGDSAYVIVQGPTWEEAEANAVKLGGHLVTINDAAENEWIVGNIGIGNGRWIGLNDVRIEGTYEWSSGENSNYVNWAPWGEPNDGLGIGQDYCWLHKSYSGYWDDNSNDGGGYQAITGIAEIKLAPNNKPTGTPSVTGTLKAGSILTIDASTIQDADNFTGYTPPFQYSWETSTDGTTWSKLTSTDATDNNTTYTLTSAEVGKRIRGVVSYLDGYGTQESVASVGSTPILNSVTKFQSTTASNHQVILAFSDAIKVSGGTSLSTSLLTVTVDGQTRRISSAQVDPTNPNQLLVTLPGSSLQSASSISVAYNAPSTGVTSGFLTDSVGTKLDAITNQSVNTYTATTNVSKSGIGSAYQNLILASSATTGYGNALNNTLTGNDGNNTLDGGAGADTMIGGKGDDTYVVDNIGDVVIEKPNEGTDTVLASISYTLGANVENLTLTGSDNLNGTGNELSNIITGNSGNNRLDGGSGADKLIGGRGDDTYVVDNAGDVVVELTSQGTDTVLASVNYTLSDNVENLTLTGTDSLTATGNTLKNTIIGNSGNNLIDGKSGADSLTGLGGADTFQFSIKPITFSSNTADHITDFSGSQGDKIQIIKSAFGIADSTASLSVVSGSTQVASALATASLFVYDSSSGELYWNQNGITKGAGSGGIFAVLDNKATLSAGNFALV